MMIKYRVSDVAKDFGVAGKEIIELLARFSDVPKKSATALVEDELDIVFEHFTQKHNMDNLDAYFAEAEQRRTAKVEQQQAAEKAAEQERAQAEAEAAKAAAPVPDDNSPVAQALAAKAAAPKKEKAKQPAPARAPIERRTVDTRTVQTNIGDKYDEKFDVMAQTSNRVRGDGGAIKKQKINQKSQQYKKPQRRRETETERLNRIQMERKQKQMTITVGETITVAELAVRLKATVAEVIKKLMMLGMMVTANQEVDFDTAYLVAEEFHAKVEREVVVTIEERIIDDREDVGHPRCTI